MMDQFEVITVANERFLMVVNTDQYTRYIGHLIFIKHLPTHN